MADTEKVLASSKNFNPEVVTSTEIQKVKISLIIFLKY